MKLRNALFFSAAAASLLTANSAFAQAGAGSASAGGGTAQSRDFGATDDIIVTARRRAEDVSKVPVAITAFSSEQIVQRGIESVQDLYKLSPGLNINGSGTRANPAITIRGQSRGITGTAAAGVIVYFNEVPLSNQGSLIQTFDMDNIQVLKGPQGTLFGRNSIGGAVLTYSKPATHEFDGYAEVELGSFGFRQFEGAVNIPVIKDVLAVRLATQIFHTDGWTPTVRFAPYSFGPGNVAIPGEIIPSERDYEEIDSKAFRGTILFEPVEGIKNVTVVDYNRQEGVNSGEFLAFYRNGVPGVANPAIWTLPRATIIASLSPRLGLANATTYADNIQRLFHCGTSIACDIDLFEAAKQKGGHYITYTNNEPNGLVKLFGVTNTTSLYIGDAVLKNIFGFRTHKTISRTDSDATPFPIIYASNTVDMKTISDELQLSGDLLNNNLKYVFGGFYVKSSPHGLGGFSAIDVNTFAGLSNALPTIYLTDQSKAIYGQVDLALNSLVEGLGVTAGVRQTWDETRACVANVTWGLFSANSHLPGVVPPYPTEAECNANDTSIARFPGAATRTNQDFAAEFKKLTWQVGANWQINPGALVYITARRGYRAGGFNVPLLDPYLSPVQAFRPETLDDIEVGTKLRWQGAFPGSLDLAVYRGKDKDVQYPEPTTALSGFIPAAGRTVSISQTTVVVNKADLTIKGFEAAGTISPFEGLVLGANASYTKISVDKLKVPPVLQELLNVAGRTAATSIAASGQPEWTFGANAAYVYPGEVMGGELRLNVDFKYSDKYRSGDFDVKSFHTVDARLTLADIGGRGIDLSVYAKNLLNAYYWFGSFGFSAGTSAQSAYVAAPRQIGIVARYRFGG